MCDKIYTKSNQDASNQHESKLINIFKLYKIKITLPEKSELCLTGLFSLAFTTTLSVLGYSNWKKKL